MNSVINIVVVGFLKQFIKHHSHRLALESTRKCWRILRVSVQPIGQREKTGLIKGIEIKKMLDDKNYEKIVDEFEVLMIKNQDISEVKLGHDKWTLKEIVGHLIDSASNNHQRFVRLQINKKTTLPGYGAEEWVNLSNIQNLDYNFVVGFWKMYNKFLINLIKNIEPLCMKNVWENKDGEEYTLEFLIDDYFTHMKSHFQMFIERQEKIEKSKAT